MQPEISILIPSLRPESIAKTIYEFDKTNFKVNYELVVVSPFKISGIKVKWVEETIPLGSVLATDIACQNASGDYIVWFNDHVSPTQDCLEKMLNSKRIQSQTFHIDAFKMETPTGKEIGPFGAYNKLYACYGCLDRRVALKFGPFNPIFRYSWADIDISLECWEKGSGVSICTDAIVIPRPMEDEVYKNHRTTFNQDAETFLNKWHSILGFDYERNPDKVNRRLLSK